MHIRFDDQLEQLNKEMINMGTQVENAIQLAVEALIKKDKEQALKVIGSDDKIDQCEKNVEHLCFKLLLQQQPVARDLRTISAALKIITDMERIGDHATDISELTLILIDRPTKIHMEKIEKMATETMLMLIHSIEAYVEHDQVKAYEVIRHDDIVDQLFDETKKELIDHIRKEASDGEQAADYLMIAKYFERIGDHATNIAEWVVYSITGRNIS